MLQIQILRMLMCVSQLFTKTLMSFNKVVTIMLQVQNSEYEPSIRAYINFCGVRQKNIKRLFGKNHTKQ